MIRSISTALSPLATFTWSSFESCLPTFPHFLYQKIHSIFKDRLDLRYAGPEPLVLCFELLAAGVKELVPAFDSDGKGLYEIILKYFAILGFLKRMSVNGAPWTRPPKIRIAS